MPTDIFNNAETITFRGLAGTGVSLKSGESGRGKFDLIVSRMFAIF